MLWWLSAVLACAKQGELDSGVPAEEAEASCDALTWETYGEGYLRSWCTGCHHSALDGDDREGAPDGVDFDTKDRTLELAERIVARATGDAPSMPPVGGSTPAEQERLKRWLACEDARD